MRVTLVLRGPEEVVIEGDPRSVLERADMVIVEWKVMWDGKEEGKSSRPMED